jgi:hypothetical protein
MPASLLVAVINTLFATPLDCIKTQLEKADSNKTYSQSIKYIYQNGGAFGFFTGVRLRFLLYLSQALLTVNLLEKLDSFKRI